MKSFIVLTLCVAAALAAPPYGGPDKDAVVLKQALENIGDGQFSSAFETSNNLFQEEQGQLKNVGSENEAIEVRGRYSYTGPDGVTYSVEYLANEDGLQPQGQHIPLKHELMI